MKPCCGRFSLVSLLLAITVHSFAPLSSSSRLPLLATPHPSMCKTTTHNTPSSASALESSLSSTMAAGVALTRPAWKRTAATTGLSLVALTAVGLVGLYLYSMAFRRTVIFWKGMAPIYLEYKWLLSFRRPYLSAEDYQDRLHQYYTRAADRLVLLILRLGGIATKIGQVLATVGQGLLPNEIVVALRVLQDGVPAKSYEQVAAIITASAGGGRSMEDLFAWFDKVPLGAASIAQVHLARLKETNKTVVVKVQYPEIRQQLNADLTNMQLAILLLSPENRELADSLRQRHERELDFTLEAAHLRECAANLQAHGVEPAMVRIPRVRNETGLCSTNILVMEYLEGTSLAKILTEEQDRLARALGKESGADLQNYLTDQLKAVQIDGGQNEDGLQGARSSLVSHPTVQTILHKTAPIWTRLFRTYATARDGVERMIYPLNRILNPKSAGTRRSSTASSKINLSRVLKTLVHVHGLQMLIDGFYNADPHPGNVLVLPDGRLGLLDYGMIGRFSERDREFAVETVLALAEGDSERTARLYTDSGYKAKHKYDLIQDTNVLHRFATFHWDRIDLSPVKWSSTGQSQDVMQLLSGVVETSVPKWIEDGRRLGALMMGPHIQSGRTFSLAKSWRGIARRAQAQLRAANGTALVA